MQLIIFYIIKAKINLILKSRDFEGLMIESRNRFYKLLDSLTMSYAVEDEELKKIFNVCYPETWNMEAVMCPWPEGKKWLRLFNFLFKHEIKINDFLDFVEITLTQNLHN